MAFDPEYHDEEPSREEVDQMPGAVVLEFGASWCGHCSSLAPHLQELLEQYPHIRHIRVADGRGKPLGRSYRVKLWPTLVFLRDGQPIQQIARPSRPQVQEGLKAIAP